MNTDKFKKLLEEEKSTIESELATVGRKNPDNPEDWEAIRTPDGVDEADELDVADAIEQYEDNRGILEQLEVQLSEVNSALEKIKTEKYGLCEVCGEKIEENRLEANPSAKTCKAHMN